MMNYIKTHVTKRSIKCLLLHGTIILITSGIALLLLKQGHEFLVVNPNGTIPYLYIKLIIVYIMELLTTISTIRLIWVMCEEYP